jgi:hypothetical protein
MANKQINELAAKTSLVGGDLIPIYDSAESGSEKTKKVTFDDFCEYGTFTPVFADASSGGNEASVGYAGGKYIKIGRFVHVVIAISNVNISTLTGANDAYITGLPFTSENAHTGPVWFNDATLENAYVVAQIDAGSTFLRFYEMITTQGSDPLRVVEFSAGNSSDLKIDISYFTA